jgi:hypothetical protein
MDFGQLNFIRDFILYPQFEGKLLFLKIAFIFISLIFALIIVILFLTTSWSRRFLFEDLTETFTARPYGAKKTFKEWLKIKNLLESQKESDYKLALIEADSLLDEILKKMGYKGENLGERLNQLDATVLSNLDQVLEAHQIRSNVLHNPDYKLTFDEAKTCLEIYEKSLRDLEAF